MEIQIVGKNMEITQTVEDYIQKKVDKLSRYLPKIDEVKIEINEEKTKSPEERFVVQITIRSKGTLLRGEERGANINMAVDTVIEVLARQIRHYKGKLYKKNRGISAVKQGITSAEVVVSEDYDVFPEIVKIKQFLVRSMLVDEATEQMELLSHDFYLFSNSENGALNLVYRRKDGNYGLIVPELI